MSDVMIDLETLSTHSNAVILTIGAIKFNRGEKLDEKCDYTSLPKERVFYLRVNIPSCVEVGMHISVSTQKWWEEQNKDIRYEAIHNTDRVDLKEALEELSKWFGESKYVWGNGSSFDITILEEAYRRCGLDTPWKFWNIRDLRTIYDLGGVSSRDVPNVGKHHALNDCYSQILGFNISLESIKNRYTNV